MAQVTLTEFLLARIAEDEAVARDVEREVARVFAHIWGGTEEPNGPDASFWADYDGAGPSVSVGPARILAECEAKRQIIARGERYGHRAAVLSEPHHIGWLDNLRDLASVYADHPDYQEAWAIAVRA